MIEKRIKIFILAGFELKSEIRVIVEYLKGLSHEVYYNDGDILPKPNSEVLIPVWECEVYNLEFSELKSSDLLYIDLRSEEKIGLAVLTGYFIGIKDNGVTKIRYLNESNYELRESITNAYEEVCSSTDVGEYYNYKVVIRFNPKSEENLLFNFGQYVKVGMYHSMGIPVIMNSPFKPNFILRKIIGGWEDSSRDWEIK